MNTSFLNDVKFVTGNIISLTDEGRKNIKSFTKQNPNIAKIGATFFVTKIRECEAEDEITELLSNTLGCTELKDTKTGEVFTILPDDEVLWAFFTDNTPHFFNIEE